MKEGKTYAWYVSMINRGNGPAVCVDPGGEFKEWTLNQKSLLGFWEKTIFSTAYGRGKSFLSLAFFQKRQGLSTPCKWGLGGIFATAKTSVIWVPNIELATTEKACHYRESMPLPRKHDKMWIIRTHLNAC